jgi:outer membrane protein assembly factor BamB
MRYASLLLIAAPALLAADWPQYNGPNGDCSTPETGINKDWGHNRPKEIWRISLGDHGYGGPSMAAGKLFIVDYKDGEDILRAVDVNIGKDAWSLHYPDPGPEQEYGFTRSTPLYSDGKVYALSRHGLLVCADVEKGEKLWSRDLVADFQGRKPTYFYSHSPIIDGEHLIVCPCGPGANLVCLDRKTGKEIWRGGGDEPAGYCTPVVAKLDGKKQYVLLTGVSVIGVDANTGAQLWSHPWRTQFNLNIATPVINGETVFVSSDYGKGCALLNLAGGKPAVLWENKLMQTHFNTPILFENSYIGNSGNATKPGDLVALDAKSGNAVFAQPGFEAGGFIEVEGMLILLNGRSGEVLLAKVDRGLREFGRMRLLGGQSWTAPILADGKLFVRNREALVCINLK